MSESLRNRPPKAKGEANSPALRFTSSTVADAFDVEQLSIERAIRGEFGLEDGDTISSHQA
jgi:hypothetical protein